MVRSQRHCVSLCLIIVAAVASTGAATTISARTATAVTAFITTAGASIDTSTSHSSRYTQDSGVDVQTCVQALRQLHHCVVLPSSHTAAACIDTSTTCTS